jgi:hypothetical protein
VRVRARWGRLQNQHTHQLTHTLFLSLSLSFSFYIPSLTNFPLLPFCLPALLPFCLPAPPPPLFPLFLPPCKPHNTLTQRTVGINRRQSGNLKTKQAAGGLAMCKVRGEVGVRVIGEVKGLCVLLPHA